MIHELAKKHGMENIKLENLFIIGSGLGGGFGGQKNFEVIEADSLEDAEKWAWENACDEYGSYAGMHGLRDINQIMEEEEIEDEDEAKEVYEEERDSWLDYSAKPFSKEYEDEIKYHHYSNRYSDITDNL